MALSEFEMIAKYFRDATPERDDTILSIGDDAALISVREGHELVTTLLQWLPDIDYQTTESAADIGRRFISLAIDNLETLKVKPAWMTLSLTFEHLDERWLKEFSQGLLGLAALHSIQLIGGDTSHGPEIIRLHLMGTQEKS